MGIIIMGETGSGKSTVGQILALRTGFELYEIGYEVKKVYLERIDIDSNLSENEKDYITTSQRLKYTDDIVKKYGNDYYVNRILNRYKNEGIIIIGPRSNAEINAIRNKIQFPFFVAFTCAKQEIVRRFIKRESQFMSPEEAKKVFEERRLRETKWGTEDVLNQSNLTIPTDNEVPFKLATTIMEKYNEFVIKQLRLKREKTENEDIPR